MRPTIDGNGPARGARLFRRLVGASSRRQTSHPINALTRSALERDGFDLGPVGFRDGSFRR
ncbi:hypothetical protein [Solicola gregarius]|uniref:Uncharacterized protein n=1 Tax=Solicola gregarius TaxID=2908642 RepID=A0AA46THF6_9ACTN|nr:hypothetical protein [Solicola gregarius]UYM05226.1 hypothetical protein L0C25_22365 [Solicola gregarius]